MAVMEARVIDYPCLKDLEPGDNFVLSRTGEDMHFVGPVKDEKFRRSTYLVKTENGRELTISGRCEVEKL